MYKPQRLRSNHGFSLLEISIALLIIGAITVAITPVLKQSSSSFYLQNSARELAAHIREVQQQAISESSSQYYIQFYLAPTNMYLIKKSSQLGPIVISSVNFPSTINLVNTNFANHKLLISAKGTPVPRGGTITIKDTVTNSYRYVIVASITGRVRVSDQPPKNWETS